MAKSLDYPGLRQQRRFGAKAQLHEPAKTQLPEPAENKDDIKQSFLASDIIIRDSAGEEVGSCECDVDLFNEYDVEDKAKLSERISQVQMVTIVTRVTILFFSSGAWLNLLITAFVSVPQPQLHQNERAKRKGRMETD